MAAYRRDGFGPAESVEATVKPVWAFCLIGVGARSGTTSADPWC